MKSVTVKLQDGVVQAETDTSLPIVPSLLWNEIIRVGFVPVSMEIWAMGTFDEHSFRLDGGRWPLANRGPQDKGPRRAHLRIVNGAEDPPKVEFLD